MLNLLLIEDDIDLASTIIDYLELEGISCDHATNGPASLTLINKHTYQVIILDINLPKMNGFTVCKHIRDAGNDTPIIMLTARDNLDDKLTGFTVGTDDYLVKPFALKELVARLNALALRRSGQVTQLTVADVNLDLSNYQLTRAGKTIHLSPTALKILTVLMRASPNVVSHDSLIKSVWGDDYPDSNNLKVQLHKLRKAVECHGYPKLIHTVPNYGFLMVLKDVIHE